MICYVYKKKGRRLWRGRYRIDGMAKPVDVPLRVSDKQAAERKLHDLVIEAEREAAGIIPPRTLREAAQCELVKHLAEYLTDLKTQGKSEGYRNNIDYRVRELITECGWRLPGEITPLSLLHWRNGATHLSAKTRNDYVAAIKSLLNWMIDHNLLLANPLAGVKPEKTKGKKTRVRRASTPDQMRRLLAVSGWRKAVYLTAAQTGFRRKELGALEWRFVILEVAVPHLHLPGEFTKNGDDAIIPLHPDVVAALRELKKPGVAETDKVFPKVPRIERFRRDLMMAGIPYRDEQGRVADFHALRYTFDTALQNTGALPRVSMELLRHSDPRLTLLRYTDASLLPTAQAIYALPSYLDNAPTEPPSHKPKAHSTEPAPPPTSAEPPADGDPK